jgi:sugar (pentulose or hexulose) kinase
MAEPLYIGIDLGTSGARAIAMDGDGNVAGEAAFAMAGFGRNHRDPAIWKQVTDAALMGVLAQIGRENVVAICIDGTSGTMLPIDATGTPLAQGRMYNDVCEDAALLDIIARHAPQESAAHGASSGLAKALISQRDFAPHKVVHQADWLAGNLCGIYSSDDNNALKTGYDPVAGCWPGWMANTGLDMALLPVVQQPGTPVACLLPAIAAKFGLPETVQIVAGTTDGCASFLATGAEQVGDGVTALGSTLTLKILSDVPVFDPASGVYSHHILGKWLAGGASNTGGNVLAAHFSNDELAELSNRIDPTQDSGLDYYPLTKPGERFPVADPDRPPVMIPVPDDRALFLQGILEGIAAIEARGYARLAELGAPKLRCLRTVGGGANNPVWNRIRNRYLNTDMQPPAHNQAAYGAARLARYGVGR